MSQNYASWGWSGSIYSERVYLEVIYLSNEIANNRSRFRAKVWNNSYNSRGDTGGMTWSISDQWAVRRTNSSGNKPTNGSNQIVLYDDFEFWISHNSDGSLANPIFELKISRTLGNIKNATVSVTVSGVPKIPRASTITTFSPFVIGSNIAWAVDRKHAAFTHRVRLSFAGEVITESNSQTGASGTLGITQAMKNRMLELVPNAISGQAILTVWTYQSQDQSRPHIGSPSVKTATGSVGVDIVPVFTGLTHSENVSKVRNLIGAYVQSKSRLNLAITGAFGGYGSWVTSYKIVTAGSVINAVSGVTNFINQSGDVPIIVTVTDARGRITSKAYSVSVLPYKQPKIEAVAFTRCDSDGTNNPLGDYLKVSLKGSVSSLKLGSIEKNKLTYRVLSKKSTDLSYSNKTNTTIEGLNYNSSVIFSGYPIDFSFSVVARILDIFDDGDAISMGMLPLGEVLQHWHKYSTSFGMLLPNWNFNIFAGLRGIKSFGPIVDKYDKEVTAVVRLEGKMVGNSGTIQIPDNLIGCEILSFYLVAPNRNNIYADKSFVVYMTQNKKTIVFAADAYYANSNFYVNVVRIG